MAVAGGQGESRILVVEDDPVGRRVAVQLVGRLGYPVDAVADGQAAVDAVAATSYALVLMDCQMPGIDGYSATAEIRRREVAHGERARRVPIVALTASRADDDRDRCLAVGMDAYLSKPIDSRQLAALIDRLARGGAAGPPGEPTRVTGPAEPSAERAPTAPPILDPAGLLGSAAELSPQHREVVELFLAAVPRRLGMLTTAAARGDRDQVARLAHTLAGSADSLGASRLAGVCARLEALGTYAADAPATPANHGNEAEAEPPTGELLAEAIDAVHRELRALQAALPRSLSTPETRPLESRALSADA